MNLKGRLKQLEAERMNQDGRGPLMVADGSKDAPEVAAAITRAESTRRPVIYVNEIDERV